MMRMRVPLVAILALALLVATAIAGCGEESEDTGAPTTGGQDLGLIEEGTLTVGTDTPYPPFEIGQPPEISGYDIDVMDAIAEKLGVEPSYQDAPFDTIFRDTANGQFDIVAAASTITPAREKTVTFSEPYYEAQQALLVPEGSDIASTDDLSGLIVGAQDATTGETLANEETDAAEVRGYPEGPDATAALTTGQVEAVIIDQPVAQDAVDKQGGVEIAEEIPTNELYGFAMAPDNDALIEAVNGALSDIKDDGTLDELYDEYFSTAPPESVLGGSGGQN